jgi:nucleoside-triphosphatase THEP1
MNRQINIVTGKIQSGKTTRLFEFITNHKDVDGILSPVVNGKRVLFHIASKTIKRFEVDESSEETISIGNYIFLQESFDWANEKLLQGYSSKPDYFVIDEVGKLELKGKGFYPSIKEILEIKDNSKTQLILVVRDYLLDEVLHYFGICNNEYEILNI